MTDDLSRSTYAEVIDGHYTKNWGTPTTALRWNLGPINDLPSDFGVLLGRRAVDMMAFATRCMSQPVDDERLELHVLCRPADAERTNLVEILTAVAHYHRTGRPLGLGHSMNFGRPWVAGSACSHGVVSIPYLDGPKLEWLTEPPVRFLWLIPVTPAEVEFKKARGMEALEERFEAAGFNCLDPRRASVV
jgi:hypothetical protein